MGINSNSGSTTLIKYFVYLPIFVYDIFLIFRRTRSISRGKKLAKSWILFYIFLTVLNYRFGSLETIKW